MSDSAAVVSTDHDDPKGGDLYSEGDFADSAAEQARELRVAWRGSPERNRVLRVLWISILVVLISSLAAWYISLPYKSIYVSSSLLPSDQPLDFKNPSAQVAGLLTLLFCGLIAAAGNIFWRNSKYKEFTDRRGVEEAERQLNNAETIADSANAESELELSAIWQVTQKRLDYYHKIATAQAEQSFRYSQLATVGGFAVLAVAALAVIVTAFSGSTAGAISSGIIGVVGAAFAGFLSRTFLRTQENSKEQLRSYFAQPLVFSQHLAAERLLSMLDGDQRAASVQELIRTMSTGAGAIDGAPAPDKKTEP